MYNGSIEHGRIISAFQRHVPDCYVRDYRDRGGFITICRGYRDLPWRDQTTTRQIYRQAVDKTLCNLPRGNVTAASLFDGVKLDRPGWRVEFRRARKHLTLTQMRAITRDLNVGEVFYGVR